MPTKTAVPLDRISDHFVNYLFDKKADQRHVRRITPWIGLLLLAVDRTADDGVTRRHVRQAVFKYQGRRFKVRYNHKAGTRGGIEFVEYFLGRGSPTGDVAVTVTSLKDAERVYRRLGHMLDEFICNGGELKGE
jgi:hypothetical protein